MARGKSIITGTKGLKKNLRKVGKRLSGAATERGLSTAALVVKRDSMKMTPTDTGNLVSSTRIQKPMPKVRDIAVGGIMGKAKKGDSVFVDYAVYVHEMIDKNVDWNKPGTGAKFLEKSLVQNANRIHQILLSNLRKGL